MAEMIVYAMKITASIDFSRESDLVMLSRPSVAAWVPSVVALLSANQQTLPWMMRQGYRTLVFYEAQCTEVCTRAEGHTPCVNYPINPGSKCPRGCTRYRCDETYQESKPCLNALRHNVCRLTNFETVFRHVRTTDPRLRNRQSRRHTSAE